MQRKTKNLEFIQDYRYDKNSNRESLRCHK